MSSTISTANSPYISQRQRSPPSHLQHPKTLTPTEFDPNFLRWMKGLDTNRQRQELMGREPDEKLKEKVFATPYQGSRHQRHHDLNQQNFTKHQSPPQQEQQEKEKEKSPSDANNNNHHSNDNNSTTAQKHENDDGGDKEKLQQTRRERSERMYKVAESLGKLRQLSPSRFMLTEKDYELKPGDEGYEKNYTKRQAMNAFRSKMDKVSPRTIVIENTQEKKERKKKQLHQQQKELDEQQQKQSSGENDEGLPTLSARDREKKNVQSNNNQNNQQSSNSTAFQQLQAQRTSAAMRCFARGFQRVVTAPAVKNNNSHFSSDNNNNSTNKRQFLVSGGSAK